VHLFFAAPCSCDGSFEVGEAYGTLVHIFFIDNYMAKFTNNLSPVINHETGNTINVRKSLLDGFGERWVQINGSNLFWRVFNGRISKKQMRGYVISNNGRMIPPRNNSLRLNVFAVLPREDWPSLRERGISVKVERNAVNKPWRLVNKNLAAKYNLRMGYANELGLWGGTLFKKKGQK